MDFFFTFNILSESSSESAHTPSEPETRAGIPIDSQYVDPSTYNAGGSGFVGNGGCLIT